jgi:CRP-like cAMP-binding protein
VRAELSGARAYCFGVDDGVAAALAASNLSRLRGSALQRLLAAACLVRVSAGSVTHREGETVEYLELVVDGLVRVFVTAPDGRSMTVRYARRGALVGVVSIYADGLRMPAGTQAVVDATVLRFSPSVVRRAASEDAHVADALLHELADRVLSFVHEITDSAFTSVRHRVARHLLDSRRRSRGPAEERARGSRSRSASENSPRPWAVCARSSCERCVTCGSRGRSAPTVITSRSSIRSGSAASRVEPESLTDRATGPTLSV